MKVCFILRNLPDEVIYTEKSIMEPFTPENTFIPVQSHEPTCMYLLSFNYMYSNGCLSNFVFAQSIKYTSPINKETWILSISSLLISQMF